MSNDVIALMLFVAQEGKCFHCDAEFLGKGLGKASKKPRRWTRDHVKLASQGYGRAFNIVLACGPCNHQRGARPASTEEIMKAEGIFKKVGTIWQAFYGQESTPWPAGTKPFHSKNVEASP